MAKNIAFLLIVGAGGFIASTAGPWWARAVGTEYNPALVLAVFIGLAFAVRILLDPR